MPRRKMIEGFDYRSGKYFALPAAEVREMEREILRLGGCRRMLGVPEGDYMLKDRKETPLVEVFGTPLRATDPLFHEIRTEVLA